MTIRFDVRISIASFFLSFIFLQMLVGNAFAGDAETIENDVTLDLEPQDDAYSAITSDKSVVTGWDDVSNEKEPIVLAISPPIFNESLKRWIEYRGRQGYKIRLMPIFKAGQGEKPDQGIQSLPVATPEEIRDRIRKIAEKKRIKAILIVGDGAPTENAAYGWRDVVPAPRVPAKVIQVFGSENHIACDGFYADFNGDDLPDAPVGRLPVETPEELDDCVEKIIRYETQCPTGNWLRRVNIVAGPNGLDLRAIGSSPGDDLTQKGSASGISALVTNVVDKMVRRLFAEYLPQEYSVSLTQFSPQSVFCPYPPDFEETVIELFNEGSLFWAYLGHGRVFGLDRYVDSNGRDYGTFEIDDCSKINCSGRAPIALFFACYTGAYDVAWRSLAEEIALQKDGPIAAIGASRKTAPYGMCVFGLSLLESAFTENTDQGQAELSFKTLGDIFYETQTRTLLARDLQGRSDEEINLDDDFDDEKSFPVEEGWEEDKKNALAPGSQLKWINKRLAKSLKETEANKRKNASFREAIDRVATIFDPTSNRLHEQLEDHVAEFNLFGDPLLRVRFPQKVAVEAPDVAYSNDFVVLTGTLPVRDGKEAIAQGELLFSNFRPNIANTRRSKSFVESEETRCEYNEEYRKANEFVVAAARVKTKNGNFRIAVQIPADYSGESILRVAAIEGERYYVGAKRILIRPKSMSPNNHETSR